MKSCILINTSNIFDGSVVNKMSHRVFYTSKIHSSDSSNKEYIEVESSIKEKINMDSFNRVMKWGDKKNNSKSVNELFSFSSFYLWQYQRFRVYFYIRNIEYEIQLIRELRLKGYKKIYIVSDYNYQREDFVPEVQIVTVSNALKKQSTKRSTIIKYASTFVARAIIGFYQQFFNSKSSHIVVDYSIKQPCIKSNGVIVNDNYSLGYLFDKLNDSFLILSEIAPPKAGQNFYINTSLFWGSVKGRKIQFSEIILLRGLLSASLRKEKSRILADISKVYILLEDNFVDPFDKLIINALKEFHSSNKYYLSRVLTYNKYFNKNKYISVAAADENGPMARSVLDAAKNRNITTVGIQHGTIHQLHPNYYFTKNETKYLPDHTFVWGEKWVKLLQEYGNYPLDSLIIAGQIRTDIIPLLQKKKKKNEFFTVVYASQPQRDSVLREQTAADVFTALKQLPQAILKVKLHPQEQNDIAYYERIAKRVGIERIEFLPKSELYLTLYEADAVITSFSTVGTEVVYFNKPLIIYDPLKQDLQKYMEEGVAFRALHAADILDILEKIICGELQVDHQKYEQFITNNAYKIDGKVTERYLSFFSSLE